jgi:hypothetical protein
MPLSRPTYSIVIFLRRKFICNKSASGMLINPPTVFTFTCQRWSSTTFNSYLALLMLRSKIQVRIIIHPPTSFIMQLHKFFLGPMKNFQAPTEIKKSERLYKDLTYPSRPKKWNKISCHCPTQLPPEPGEVSWLDEELAAEVEVVDERVAVQLLQPRAALTQHCTPHSHLALRYNQYPLHQSLGSVTFWCGFFVFKFLSYNLPGGTLSSVLKIKFLLKFCVKIFILQALFQSAQQSKL